jgi:hypothetical protein
MAQNDAFTTFLVRSGGTNLSKVGGCFAVEELLINFAEERVIIDVAG